MLLFIYIFIAFYFCSLYLLSSFAEFIGDVTIYLIYLMHAIHWTWRPPIGDKTRHKTLCCHDNDLIRNWQLRTKYVDDVTILEVIPSKSLRILDIAVRDIHDYSVSHRMKFNPKECNELVINFMADPNTVMRTIWIGNQVVETVKTYKLLGG